MPGTSRTRFIFTLLVALAAAWFFGPQHTGRPVGGLDAEAAQATAVADPVRDAFQSSSSGRILMVKGAVERILADDRDGSPHQRFILRIPGGVTLLIAHNLDLAPRLEGLKPGDSVTVLGEYEWNEKGGVMHWTHDDPRRRHATGYIEWRGRRYQ